MAFDSIDSADIQAGKPVDNDLMTQIKDNEDANNAALAGAGSFDIPNGDMELTDAGFPANWAQTTYPGGTAGLETASPINGSQSMKFVHPGGGGNGGGFADSDYLPCGEGAPFRISWLHKVTASGMKNQVFIRWFDKDKVFISATTIYESTNNPTTETQFSNIANPVSGARFWRVRSVGGFNDTDVAGDAIFDAFTTERDRTRISTVTSPVSSVVFTNIIDSKRLRLTAYGAISSSSVFNLSVSSDNGATWDTSAIYFQAIDGANDTVASTGFVVTSGIAGAPKMFTVEIIALGQSEYTSIQTDSTTRGGTPNFQNFNSLGGINSTTAYNAIRLTTGGNINTGTFILEEIF